MNKTTGVKTVKGLAVIGIALGMTVYMFHIQEACLAAVFGLLAIVILLGVEVTFK